MNRPLTILLSISLLLSGYFLSIPIPSSSAQPITPASRVLLPVRGLYVSFERRGWASMYYGGETIDNFFTFDPVVGRTVGEEVALQLDAIQQMGVNTITYELRATDPTSAPFVYPTCNINPPLGFQYPQPTQTEVTNLVAFLDLVQSKGIKVFLRLVNTHMEEQPPTKNSIWLGTILNAIKNHPALDLVLFEGSPRFIDTNGDNLDDACGIPAEPPLWMGPTDPSVTYIQWAISYAHSLGMPYRKLSAEAIVGDYYEYHQGPSGPRATDSHLWDPVYVLKGIFDDLLIPIAERTYAISIYEHRKCITARELPCTDTDPHAWAIETVKDLFNTIGQGNGARVDAVEMGLNAPGEVSWNTGQAMESLVWIMQNYGIEGGCFYQWASNSYVDEFNPAFVPTVKKRGLAFTYHPVKDVLESLYTLGQTDDLSLTPDSNPPVFSAVSATPTIVKNGDSLEITAHLGETHLFVTADVSGLDSAGNDPVVLLDQGDGTYTGSFALSPWNVARNGIKEVQLKAMDFWSNAATTELDITFQNPPPIQDSVPPNDSFDGAAIDHNKWIDISSGGGTVAQDGQLIFQTGNLQPFSSAGVQSTWAFPSDFDIQVDFHIGEGWSQPAVDHLDGAAFGVLIDGQMYHVTRWIRDNGSDVVAVWSSTGALLGEAATSVLSGKYRLLRQANTLILLYDFGAGWGKMGDTTVPIDPAAVYIQNSSHASQVFTTNFDNFQVNSGLTTYRLKIFLPLIR